MWITELAMKTRTAETRIGSHSVDSAVIGTSFCESSLSSGCARVDSLQDRRLDGRPQVRRRMHRHRNRQGSGAETGRAEKQPQDKDRRNFRELVLNVDRS